MTPTSGDTPNNPETIPAVDAPVVEADLIGQDLFPNVRRSQARVADGMPTFVVPSEDLTAVVEYLHEKGHFTLFEDITAVDWLPKEPRFEVVYHFLSLAARQAICLKVPVSGQSPQLPTITPIFKGANWYETRDIRPVRYCLRRPPGFTPDRDAGGLGRLPAPQGLPGDWPAPSQFAVQPVPTGRPQHRRTKLTLPTAKETDKMDDTELYCKIYVDTDQPKN